MTSGVLEVQGLTIQFGGLKAVNDLSFCLNQGSIYGIIGPNGAGKTTVFNLLTGVYKPSAGRIRVSGKDIVGLEPFEITACGLARTFQNVRLFREQTVLENMLIPMDRDPARPQFGLLSSLFRVRPVVVNDLCKERDAMDLLRILGIENRAEHLAQSLPYGEQRRLEIARALATGSRIILLDEPAAGMNPQEKIELMKIISDLRVRLNLTILLIEHDMKLVMGICEKILVLNYGERIAEGTPLEIQNNSQVIDAYLGSQRSPM